MSTKKYKRAYQVRYWHYFTNVHSNGRKPDAYGGSNVLDNLIRNAAGRCAIENYRGAVIVDPTSGTVLARLKRTANGITITKES